MLVAKATETYSGEERTPHTDLHAAQVCRQPPGPGRPRQSALKLGLGLLISRIRELFWGRGASRASSGTSGVGGPDSLRQPQPMCFCLDFSEPFLAEKMFSFPFSQTCP